MELVNFEFAVLTTAGLLLIRAAVSTPDEDNSFSFFTLVFTLLLLTPLETTVEKVSFLVLLFSDDLPPREDLDDDVDEEDTADERSTEEIEFFSFGFLANVTLLLLGLLDLTFVTKDPLELRMSFPICVGSSISDV